MNTPLGGGDHISSDEGTTRYFLEGTIRPWLLCSLADAKDSQLAR